MTRIDDLVTELNAFDAEDTPPFPYVGCRRLLREHPDEQYEGLIPDLDLYFGELAGYRGSGKRLLKWPAGRIIEARQRITRTFFDRHPVYADLKPEMTAANVPDLHAELTLAEQTRTVLVELLVALGDRQAVR